MAKKKQQDQEANASEEQNVETPQEEVEEASAAEETSAEAEQQPTLEEQLAAAREEVQKNWDLYLRQRADMENLRKRAKKEKEDMARFGNENIIREIVPVLDNLERAVEHAKQENSGGETLLQGVEMTLNMFTKGLEKFGVKPFDSIGETFDPSRHEAMGQLESADQEPNTVLQEMQKGYLLNDRLLRPALVMVAKAPVKAQTEE